MAQLYSVRSESSWGIGDFQDLGQLAETLAPHADFLLVNPLHAAEPLPPVEDSPYLPTTRRGEGTGRDCGLRMPRGCASNRRVGLRSLDVWED